MAIVLASAAGWLTLGITIGWIQIDPTTSRRHRRRTLTAAVLAGLAGGALIPLIGITASSPLWTLSLITAMAGALTATLAIPETLSEPTRPLSTQKEGARR